jgi:hypothetical protein
MTHEADGRNDGSDSDSMTNAELVAKFDVDDPADHLNLVEQGVAGMTIGSFLDYVREEWPPEYEHQMREAARERGLLDPSESHPDA